MNLFIKNIRQLVTVASNGKPFKAGKEMRELNVVEHASVLIENGIIRQIGSAGEVSAPRDVDELDAANRVALPGFVDSHTHAVFAGSRENEFAMRAEGKSYADIAGSGGGILSTMTATRAAAKKDLLRPAGRRLNEMMKLGTTTVEIKSGYGLNAEAESKMLDVIHDLRRDHYMTVVPTFMGAHAFPPEFSEDKNRYVELITNKMLPYIGERQLAVFCDVFCDEGYFDLHQTEQILLEAKRFGLIPKLHADQLAAIGGTELGVQLNAISVDHLEHLSASGIEALRRSSTIATVLPGASFFLNQPYAPARTIIDATIPLAIASDCNPGTSMSFSMPMMMTIACTQMKMTPEEAITACTLNGAAALGLSHETGSIEVGKQADIILYDVPNYRYIPYHYGSNLASKIIKNGTVLEF
ncbi:MAG TPA: imidazolonepropionase [Bacteroidota bacterium]|nr:imidazolonepropionase [Bacteroidota bacterium]